MCRIEVPAISHDSRPPARHGGAITARKRVWWRAEPSNLLAVRPERTVPPHPESVVLRVPRLGGSPGQVRRRQRTDRSPEAHYQGLVLGTGDACSGPAVPITRTW